MYPKINELIVSERIQPLYNEFLFDFNGNKFPIKVNKTAADILELCNGKNTKRMIIEKIAKKYNEQNAKAKSFVEDFLEQAEKRQHIYILKNKLVDEGREIEKIGSLEYWTPELIAIELTHNCPLKCKHCYINAGTGNNMNSKIVLKILDECKEMGIENVQYTGGEPLVHPDFFNLLEAAIEKASCIL